MACTISADEIKRVRSVAQFNNQGIFKFVLQEVNTTDDDNQELRVADYYKHFPRVDGDVSPGNTIDPDNTTTDDGRKVWL